jgi:hypothetical protein
MQVLILHTQPRLKKSLCKSTPRYTFIVRTRPRTDAQRRDVHVLANVWLAYSGLDKTEVTLQIIIDTCKHVYLQQINYCPYCQSLDPVTEISSF